MAKILLIDDSWLTRRALSNILKSSGHDVLEAENGVQGMDMAKANSPDLILLDLLMPEMNGFDFLTALKDEDLQIPTIVVSADIQDTARERCIRLGANGFVNKPPKEDELVGLIQEALSA